MRTFTITAIALAVAVGSVSGQTGRTDRTEREARERAVVRQQIEQLEVQYRDLVAALSQRRGDRAYVQRLREVEEALARAHAQLQDIDVASAEEMRAVERALQEHQARLHEVEREMDRAHTEQQRHLEMERAREFDEQHAARVAEEMEAVRHQLEQRQGAQAEHAARVAEEMEAVRHQLEQRQGAQAEHAARVAEEMEAVRHQLEQRQDVRAERALRAAEEAMAERAESVDRLNAQAERQLRDALEQMQVLERQLQERHDPDAERALRAAANQVETLRHQLQNRHELEMQRSLRTADEAVVQRQQSRERADLERERRQMDVYEELLRNRDRYESVDVEGALDRLYGDGPRAAWARQDPADSLWRAARDRMNRSDYEAASRLFARIHTQQRYRQSEYRADALYWHAFALNRLGSRDNIRESLELLQQLVREYPEEDRHADTNGLLVQVQVRLAEMGNADARQQVRAAAIDEVRVTSPRPIDPAELQYVRAVEQGERAEQAAVARGVTTTAPLVTELLPTGQVRAVNLQGLALTGDATSVLSWGLPPGRLNSLSPQCARGESEIQLIALNSLVRMDTAAALPVLREVMARRGECDAPLRQSAMTIVARVRTPDASRILTDAARRDPDTGVRRTALIYLSSRDEDAAVGIAEEALRTANTTEERQWALQSLSRMRTDRAWAVIRDYAGRSDLPSETRRSAIAILSGSNDPANAAFLRQLYEQVGSDRTLKEAILMSSAFRRGAADPEWLIAIAQDDGEEDRIREYAVMTLSRNEEVGTPRFVALYDRSDDKRVKLALVRVLSGRAESESVAVDKLIAIARTETDTDLRKTAVLGLPTSDPRARELLLEILRGS